LGHGGRQGHYYTIPDKPNTVAGFIAALNSDQGLGEVINFGSNFEISIGDTVQLIAEAMNAEVEIITDEVRLRPENSEVERLWADTKPSAACTCMEWVKAGAWPPKSYEQ